MVLLAHSMAEPVRQPAYTIGDMARTYGVSLRTLRFYEDLGLLAPRRDGSARCYSARDRIRLELVLTGKRIGFTLAEISELIAKRLDETSTGSIDLPNVLSQSQVETQIDLLEQRRIALDDAIKQLRQAHKRLRQQPVSNEGKVVDKCG